MVWFHGTPSSIIPIFEQVTWHFFTGGGFQAGSSHDAPPDMIMQSSANPMIFVSFEYRLGQFGFLGNHYFSHVGVFNLLLNRGIGYKKWREFELGVIGSSTVISVKYSSQSSWCSSALDFAGCRDTYICLEETRGVPNVTTRENLALNISALAVLQFGVNLQAQDRQCFMSVFFIISSHHFWCILAYSKQRGHGRIISCSYGRQPLAEFYATLQ